MTVSPDCRPVRIAFIRGGNEHAQSVARSTLLTKAGPGLRPGLTSQPLYAAGIVICRKVQD